MTAFSNYLEEQLIKHIFRTDSYTKPTVLAVGLCLVSPDENDTGQLSLGTGQEVANSYSYSRQVLNPSNANWSDPSAGTQGQTTNSTAITFTADGGNWGTVTSFFIADNASYDSGNILFYGDLSESRTINDRVSFTISIGSLGITFN